MALGNLPDVGDEEEGGALVAQRWSSGESPGAKEVRRKRELHRADDVQGLSTDEQGRIPQETTASGAILAQSPNSTDFMRAVAVALVQEEIAAHTEERQPQTVKALERAGCPVDVWVEMANNPDFQLLLQQVEYALVILPKEPRAALAFANEAALGKPAALKALDRWREEMHPETAALLKTYSEGERGRELFLQQLETYQQELDQLKAGFATKRADDKDIIDEARERIDEVRARPNIPTIDHKALYGS